ncbi:MAG TPA: DUF4097 family beta strand repeat-containing protein [Dehalococcoidia bacterium]|nr:DUF4097 family beta strand repeat-containing protein [Dehalococcoidia bacterium]
MDTQRFDLPVAVALRIQSRSGKVDVVAEPREDVLVEGDGFDAQEVDGGAALEIRSGRGGSKSLSVRCPVGTDVVIGTHSGGIHTEGALGIVSATTMSAHIEVDRADEADLRTGSGNITVRGVRGRCRLNSMSGKIEGGTLGACACGTMSGSIRIERVIGPLKARTVSGSVEANCEGEGAIAVKSVSGKVQIGLPEGTSVSKRFKTISGRVRCPFPEGDDCSIEAMTVSGSIELVPG